MLDFSSALYLGLRHPSRTLRPWVSLSSGRPAVLGTSPSAVEVARQLAALIGCESAVLLPSTLHLFWDVFGLLAQERIAIHMDEGVYAIARWGVERAAACGTPVRQFRHHSPAHLLIGVEENAKRGLRPVVVTDGFCPGCGESSPVPAYLDIARRHGGILVLDDTQALGVLGRSATTAAPFGTGGGGTLRHSNVSGSDILVGCSLAKGFGVPVAVLAGGAAWLNRFEQHSATRTHCSPPSAAVIQAAARALALNASHGDLLRRRLAQRITQFRSRLLRAGYTARGGLFPVQILEAVDGVPATDLHRNLARAGVRAVPLRGHQGGAVGFLITARHYPEHIDRAVEALVGGIAGIPHPKAMTQYPREASYEQAARI